MHTTQHIGIDFGTTNLKCCVISDNGSISFSRTFRHDGEKNLRNLGLISCSILRVLKEVATAIPPAAFSNIYISSIAPNLILLDEKRRVQIGETLLFFDDDAFEIEQRLDDELRSAKWQNEVLSKLLFQLSSGAAELTESRIRIFNHHSFFVWQATGQYYIDKVTASEFGTLYDDATGDWNWMNVKRFNLGSVEWPKIVSPTHVFDFSSEHLVLPRELGQCRFFAGSSDTLSTFASAHAEKQGDNLLYFGTFNSAARLRYDLLDILTGKFLQNPFDWWCSIPRSGQQLEGMARILFPDMEIGNALAEFEKTALQSDVGSRELVFLHNPDLDNTTVSTRPSANLIGLRPFHTRNDIARSVLEAFAFTLKWNGQTENIFTPSARFFCEGGGAQLPGWLQIVSDTLQFPLFYTQNVTSAVGSAVISKLGANNFGSWQYQEIPDQSITRVDPNRSAKEKYEAAYSRFRSVAFPRKTNQ